MSLFAGLLQQLDARFGVQQRLAHALAKAQSLDAAVTRGYGAWAVTSSLHAAVGALTFVKGEFDAERSRIEVRASFGFALCSHDAATRSPNEPTHASCVHSDVFIIRIERVCCVCSGFVPMYTTLLDVLLNCVLF